MKAPHFTPEVASKIRHYVYLYIDPTSDSIFYVGEGAGERAFSHLRDTSDRQTCARIAAIREQGKVPRIELLVHGLTKEAARQVEAAVIDLIGPSQLTNRIRGWGAGVTGRMTLEQLRAQYGAAEVEIVDPCVLIRINDLFRYGMTPIELYDATRGVWVTGPKRDRARYALAVFRGVVQEVYQITAWFPGGSTLSSRPDTDYPGRWEFVGKIAPDKLRRRYVFRSVRRYLPQGAQNPIRYVALP